MKQETKQTFDDTELDKQDWEQISRSLADAADTLNVVTVRRLDGDRGALNKLRGREVCRAADAIAKCPDKVRKDLPRYMGGCAYRVDFQIQTLQYMINTIRHIPNAPPAGPGDGPDEDEDEED